MLFKGVLQLLSIALPQVEMLSRDTIKKKTVNTEAAKTEIS